MTAQSQLPFRCYCFHLETRKTYIIVKTPKMGCWGGGIKVQYKRKYMDIYKKKNKRVRDSGMFMKKVKFKYQMPKRHQNFG